MEEAKEAGDVEEKTEIGVGTLWFAHASYASVPGQSQVQQR